MGQAASPGQPAVGPVRWALPCCRAAVLLLSISPETVPYMRSSSGHCPLSAVLPLPFSLDDQSSPCGPLQVPGWPRRAVLGAR